MDRTRLVIICTQNSARSQMAEAFFKKYGDDVLEVHSAGFEPQKVNPLAKQVMAEGRCPTIFPGVRI